jgi:hypothetical protein
MFVRIEGNCAIFIFDAMDLKVLSRFTRYVKTTGGITIDHESQLGWWPPHFG